MEKEELKRFADSIKKEIAEQNGFEVMVVWESDYFNNKTEVIKRCRDFIL